MKPTDDFIANSNNREKLKVTFSVSLGKDSIVEFLNELSNINSHLEDEDLISNLWFLNDSDMDGSYGYIINFNNWSNVFQDIDYISTSQQQEQVPGLYLIVKRKSIKSNYIF